MLQWIEIRNFVIIEKTRIDLCSGLNVISGETGSGKSLILNAIRFGLGHKLPVNPVGSFDDCSSVTLSLIINQAEYLIKRTITASGKSGVCVNGEKRSLTWLKALCEPIIAIHQQNSLTQWVHKDRPRECLDLFIDLDKSEYTSLYQTMIKCRKTLKDFKKQYQSQDHIDMKLRELKELDLLKPSLEEYEEVSSKIKAFDDLAKQVSLDSDIKDYFKESKVLSHVQKLQQLIQTSTDLILKQQITDVVLNIEDIQETFTQKSSLNQVQYDLAPLEARLKQYQPLIKRYGSLNHLCSTYGKLQDLAQQAIDYDETIKHHQQALTKAEDEVFQSAQQLSIIRMQGIKHFTQKVTHELSKMHLDKIEFDLVHSSVACNATGCDHFDFQVNLNKQSNASSLFETASGGEMSRFILAILMTLANKQDTQLYLFDEIDAGVSGLVADSMGTVFKDIAQSAQVLIITHQAPVASYADKHFSIHKQHQENYVESLVQSLEPTERIHELAMMMSGSKSHESLELARQLLEKGGIENGSHLSY